MDSLSKHNLPLSSCLPRRKWKLRLATSDCFSIDTAHARQYFLAAAIFPRKYGRVAQLERRFFLGNFVAATQLPNDQISCDTVFTLSMGGHLAADHDLQP